MRDLTGPTRRIEDLSGRPEEMNLIILQQLVVRQSIALSLSLAACFLLCSGTGASEQEKRHPVSESADAALQRYGVKILGRIQKHWHWIPPVREGGATIANVAIDKHGRLKWVSLDPKSDAYGNAVVQAIVRSAPFPPLPSHSPAEVVLRIPFSGSDRPYLTPEIAYDITKPDKPDWNGPGTKSGQSPLWDATSGRPHQRGAHF